MKPQFFLSELRETNNNTDKNDLSKNEFNKNNIIKIRKILKFPRTKKYIQSKNINILSQFNKQKKEDQIYFLIDSIFSDKKGNIKEEQTKYEEDSTLESGVEEVKQSGHEGCVSEAYKIVRLNGETISSTRPSRDTYSALDRIIRIGTKPAASKQTVAEPTEPAKP